MAYGGHNWVNDGAPAINATNLNEMDNELVLLDGKATETNSAIVEKTNQISALKTVSNNIIGLQQYAQINNSELTVNNNKRYKVADGTLVDAANYVAIRLSVLPGEKYKLYKGLYGYSSAFAIIVMSGNDVLMTETDSGNTASAGVYELTIPANATELRLNSSTAAYPNSKIERIGNVIEASLQNLNSRVRVIDVFSDYTKTDGQRYGYVYGDIVEASGYSTINFSAKKGDIFLFKGGLIGTSNTLGILLMSQGTVTQVINNTGNAANAGIYELTVPDGVDEIRMTMITAQYKSYRILKAVNSNLKNYVGALVPANASKRMIVVGAGGISSIQMGCDIAEDGDYVFVKSGTYTEQVSIWQKHIHLIGENRDTTILIDHSGYYDTPPLEMNLGSLSNFTIIEDGTSPTGSSSDSKYMMAYCLHIEANKGANVEEFVINNCTFINDIHCPIGCGLYPDYTVHFRNCTIRSNATNEGDNERGSFYFHTNGTPNVRGQHMIVEQCLISTAENRAVYAGVPAGAGGSGQADYRFSGCTLWSDVLGESDSIIGTSTTGGDFLTKVNSYGNNVAILNN